MFYLILFFVEMIVVEVRDSIETRMLQLQRGQPNLVKSRCETLLLTRFHCFSFYFGIEIVRLQANRKRKILKYAPTRINYLTYSTLFIILDFAFGLVCTGVLTVSVCVYR